jgi:hypothetical protein
LELSWCRVSFLKGDLQFSKFLKNTICIGLCKLKCTEKRFIPFTPLHFLPEFVPHTEFKGRPEDAKWNVLNHTSFRNYAPFSLQVPSILSILLEANRLQKLGLVWRNRKKISQIINDYLHLPFFLLIILWIHQHPLCPSVVVVEGILLAYPKKLNI